MFESKYATREDIDAAMRFGCGYPMGPLALLDLIGLDTAYEILDTMYKQGRDRLHAPAPILKQMVTAACWVASPGGGSTPTRRRTAPSWCPTS
ncbi:MAG: 3-hydroxyacyl-CoA dehydrogenase family protein [Nocardioides sp.]